MKNAIHIGTDVDLSKVEKTLPQITESILNIINTSAGDSVKHKALDILKGLVSCDIKNTNISECSIDFNSETSSAE